MTRCKVTPAFASDVASSTIASEYRLQFNTLAIVGVTTCSATNDREKVIRGPNARLAQTPRFADDLYMMMEKSRARSMGD